MRLRPLVLGVSVLLLDCAALEKLTPGACGNRVVDADEDCDQPNEDDGGAGARRCGQPEQGATLRCHFVCTTTTDCPSGWGCSVDGICRAPSGTFSAAGDAFSAGVQTLFAGDFDGDGRKDILGTGDLSGDNASKARVHFLGSGGVPSNILSLPGLLTSPYVVEIDGDRRDDIAFGFSLTYADVGGFGLLLGQKDRTFVQRMFPSFTAGKLRATAVRVQGTVPTSEGPPPIIGVVEQEENGVGIQILTALAEQDTNAFTVSLGPQKILGDPVWGRIFDKDTSSACGEVVVLQRAQSGGVIVKIFSPCMRPASGPVGWNVADAPPMVQIVLPGNPDEKNVAAFVADVDGDGDADVLVSGYDQILVVESNGGATPLARSLAAPRAFPLVRGVVELPLAAADLDGNGVLEYVLPSGIATRVPPDGGPLANEWVKVPLPTKRWTRAIVADINFDSRLDVIGTSSVEPDIDILEGSGTLFLPPFHVPTNGPIRDTVLADVDFDGVSDIVFVETQASSTEGTLAISYGRTTLPPEPPRVIGRLDGMKQVFVNPGFGLAVSAEKDTGASLPDFSFAAVFNSGERQPLAPLIFNEQADRRPLVPYAWIPKAVAAAPFFDAAHRDLFALAIGFPDFRSNTPQPRVQGIWAAPGTAAGFDTAREVLEADQVRLLDRDSDSLQIAIAVGNVDADPRAEVVGIANGPLPGQSTLIVDRFNKTEPFVSLQTALLPGVFVPSGAQAQLADLDEDGDLDLVAALVYEGRPRILVFFNDGSNPMQPFNPTPVAINTRAERIVRSFAVVTTGAVLATGDGRRRRDLVIVSVQSVERASLLDDRRSFFVEDVTSLFGGERDFKNGSGVTTGDFDGDGVEDIAVAEGGAIRIARQTPVGVK